MDRHDEIARALFAVGATLLHFLFGGWTLPLKVLVTLMVIDYVTGVIAAFVNKELDSSVGIRGVAKKVGILSLVVVSRMVDLLAGLENPVVQTVVIYGFVGHEGISIAENAAKMGLWVPRVLKDALVQLRKKGDEHV